MLLERLNEDIILFMIQYLAVQDILALRQTCKFLRDLTFCRSVWLTACTVNVLEKGLPFPSEPISTLAREEIERRTRQALDLQANWMSSRPHPRSAFDFLADPWNIILDVRFIPKPGHEWLITVSTRIWSVLICWDLNDIGSDGPRKLGECSFTGELIQYVVIDRDPASEACVALTLVKDNAIPRILVLQIRTDELDPTRVIFERLACLKIDQKPLVLQDDIIVTSDRLSETRITNWRTGELATLRSLNDETFQDRRCHQVIFCYNSVLVVRSHSFDLFPYPELRSEHANPIVYKPFSTHTFGRVDSIAVAPMTRSSCKLSPPSISILVRGDIMDINVGDIHTLNFYTLEPNPSYDFTKISTNDDSQRQQCPYTFPPVLIDSVPSRRGFLYCSDIALGSGGTAIWLQPRPRDYAGLTMLEEYISHLHEEMETFEWLNAAILPGPFYRTPAVVDPLHANNVKVITSLLSRAVIAGLPLFNGNDLRTSLDYDEVSGRIALGGKNGTVTILEMARRF